MFKLVSILLLNMFLVAVVFADVTGPVTPFGSGGSSYPNLSYQADIYNGYTLGLVPQSVGTGLFAQSANANFGSSSQLFTGNVWDDTVVNLGYNVGTLSNYALDPFAHGIYFESNFESNTGQAGTSPGNWTGNGTASSVTSTTLTDTTQNWPVNMWAGFTLCLEAAPCNTGSPVSAKVVSNTNTVLTISTSTVTGGTWPTTGTPAYQLMNDTMEMYSEFIEQTGNSSTNRAIRPWFFDLDRGIAKAQAALGTNGAITVTAATASGNPTTFTTSTSHGFIPGYSWVQFKGLAGGTWSTLNGHQYQVKSTPTATSFTVQITTTGFGTYTASSGTATSEPNMPISEVAVDNNNGFYIAGSSWTGVGYGGDPVGTIVKGAVDFYASNPTTGNDILTLHSGTSGANYGMLQLTYNNGVVGQVLAQGNSLQDVVGNGSGSLVQAQVCKYASNSLGTCTFGPQDNFNDVLVAISNSGGTASTPMLHLRAASSQTGNMLELNTNAAADNAPSMWVDNKFLVHPVIYTVSQLPPCSASVVAYAAVSDFSGTPTYHGAIGAGGSTVYTPVACINGTWVTD